MAKLFAVAGPQLEGLTPEANANLMNQSAYLTFKKFPGLRMGMLPAQLFPNPPPSETPPQTKAVALVGRAPRSYNNRPSHRIRLDRYDDDDFQEQRMGMSTEGLWLLRPEESY